MSRAKKLTQFVEGYDCEFSWVGSNCTHLAADYLLVMEGKDYMLGIDLSQGLRKTLRQYGGDLVEACSRVLDREPISIRMAQTGDLVYTSGEGVFGSLGICLGMRSAFRHPERGLLLTTTPIQGVAWRVG